MILNYGPFLKKWRKDKNISQRELGILLNISGNYVSLLETSTIHVTLTRLKDIADLLQIPLTELINKSSGEKTYQDGFKEATSIAAEFFKKVSECNAEFIMKSLNDSK